MTYYKTPQGAYLKIIDGKVKSPSRSELRKLKAGKLSAVSRSLSDIYKLAKTQKTKEVKKEPALRGEEWYPGKKTHYKIQSGDSLSTIAKRYGVSVDEIMEANKNNPAIKTKDLIYAGKTITIPDVKAKEEPEKEKEKEKEKPPVFDPATYAEEKNYTSYFQKEGQWYANVQGAWKPVASKEEARKLSGKVEEEKNGGEGDGNGDEKGDEFEIPENLKDNSYFAQLPEDTQKIIAYYASILESDDKARQEAFSDALDLAEEQADPYWKEQIRLVKDDLQTTFADLAGDLESREKELTRRRQAIEEDLKYNREYLTTDQQAELARRKREYDVELDNTREEMARKGLTFSTIRSEAEERLVTAQEDIITSTKRQYAARLRAEEVGAERGIEDIIAKRAEVQKLTKEAQRKGVRGVERILGTKEITKPEYQPYLLGVGDEEVTGTMAEKKATDILKRAEALMLQSL